MLRAVLLASPLLLALVSCGDSSSSFEDLPGGTSTGANGGEGTGATSSSGGSSAGKNSGAGTSNTGGSKAQAGSGNGGSDNTAGGAGNDAGTSSVAGNGNDAGKGNLAGNGGATQGGSGGNAPGGNAGMAQGGNAGTSQGGTGGSAAGSGGTGGSAAGSGGTSGITCPNLFGAYEIKASDGACNGLNDKASQSIAGTDVACFAHFVSIAVGPAGSAVNGGAMLDANGDFSGATLTFGKAQRTPCSGKWDAGQERMTIKCGAGNEVCTVVMDRK